MSWQWPWSRRTATASAAGYEAALPPPYAAGEQSLADPEKAALPVTEALPPAAAKVPIDKATANRMRLEADMRATETRLRMADEPMELFCQAFVKIFEQLQPAYINRDKAWYDSPVTRNSRSVYQIAMQPSNQPVAQLMKGRELEVTEILDSDRLPASTRMMNRINALLPKGYTCIYDRGYFLVNMS
jgi:hypothetical protein